MLDPICGMEINKKEAKFSSQLDRKTYYFCSQNCKDKFDKEPKQQMREESHGCGCCH